MDRIEVSPALNEDEHKELSKKLAEVNKRSESGGGRR